MYPRTPTCPLEAELERLNAAGHGVHVWGWTPDGTRALVVNADTGTASIAPADTANGLGRFECSTAHLAWAEDLYRGRFPLEDWERPPVRPTAPDMFGGYLLLAIADDGAELCEACAVAEMHVGGDADGFRFEAWESTGNLDPPDEGLFCAQCSRELMAATG